MPEAEYDLTGAACADMDVRVFHDSAWDVGAQRRKGGFESARLVCEGCPVRPACLRYAIGLPSVEGVYAGYDPQQIRKMRNAT